MSDMQVQLVPALRDNYIFIIIAADGTVAVMDPGDEASLVKALDHRGLKPSLILNTHHHGDHTDANKAIKQRYGAELIGPASEAARIEGLDRTVSEGDTVAVGPHKARVIATPGHTAGHIAFAFEDDQVLFCGDTLFPMGCGRVFEGTHEQMWESLSKLAALPDETRVYCAHEYTMANADFARLAEPDNERLAVRAREVEALRARQFPTVPTTIGLERATNPFLRAGSAGRFAELRKQKDAA